MLAPGSAVTPPGQLQKSTTARLLVLNAVVWRTELGPTAFSATL